MREPDPSSAREPQGALCRSPAAASLALSPLIFPTHLNPVRPPGLVWILPLLPQPGSYLLTVNSSTCKAHFHFSLPSRISVPHACCSVSESCCLIICAVLQFFKAREIVFQSLLNSHHVWKQKFCYSFKLFDHMSLLLFSYAF